MRNKKPAISLLL